jgi:hypothetical protein
VPPASEHRHHYHFCNTNALQQTLVLIWAALGTAQRLILCSMINENCSSSQAAAKTNTGGSCGVLVFRRVLVVVL